jgi:hypothetical protein
VEANSTGGQGSRRAVAPSNDEFISELLLTCFLNLVIITCDTLSIMLHMK